MTGSAKISGKFIMKCMRMVFLIGFILSCVASSAFAQFTDRKEDVGDFRLHTRVDNLTVTKKRLRTVTLEINGDGSVLPSGTELKITASHYRPSYAGTNRRSLVRKSIATAKATIENGSFFVKLTLTAKESLFPLGMYSVEVRPESKQSFEVQNQLGKAIGDLGSSTMFYMGTQKKYIQQIKDHDAVAINNAIVGMYKITNTYYHYYDNFLKAQRILWQTPKGQPKNFNVYRKNLEFLKPLLETAKADAEALQKRIHAQQKNCVMIEAFAKTLAQVDVFTKRTIKLQRVVRSVLVQLDRRPDVEPRGQWLTVDEVHPWFFRMESTIDLMRALFLEVDFMIFQNDVRMEDFFEQVVLKRTNKKREGHFRGHQEANMNMVIDYFKELCFSMGYDKVFFASHVEEINRMFADHHLKTDRTEALKQSLIAMQDFDGRFIAYVNGSEFATRVYWYLAEDLKDAERIKMKRLVLEKYAAVRKACYTAALGIENEPKFRK